MTQAAPTISKQIHTLGRKGFGDQNIDSSNPLATGTQDRQTDCPAKTNRPLNEYYKLHELATTGNT